jgi:hypothetical protein
MDASGDKKTAAKIEKLKKTLEGKGFFVTHLPDAYKDGYPVYEHFARSLPAKGNGMAIADSGRGHDRSIGSYGTVYVGSLDNKLYAIKTDSEGPAKSPWPMRGQNSLHTGRVMKK